MISIDTRLPQKLSFEIMVSGISDDSLNVNSRLLIKNESYGFVFDLIQYDQVASCIIPECVIPDGEYTVVVEVNVNGYTSNSYKNTLIAKSIQDNIGVVLKPDNNVRN